MDLPLAVLPETGFRRRRLRIDHGDRLLVVTDGVLETPGRDGELYGDERVDALLRRHEDSTPREIGDALLAEMRAHGGDHSLVHDDVTFLLVEFVPGPPGPAIWTAVRNRLFRPRNKQSRRLAAPRHKGPIIGSA
jgi:serine phosphatase RsbU (regulator of sigma subunit)